jgi:hypothetical protein
MLSCRQGLLATGCTSSYSESESTSAVLLLLDASDASCLLLRNLFLGLSSISISKLAASLSIIIVWDISDSSSSVDVALKSGVVAEFATVGPACICTVTVGSVGILSSNDDVKPASDGILVPYSREAYSKGSNGLDGKIGQAKGKVPN